MMRRLHLRQLVCFGLLVAFTPDSPSQDWPQWRGLNRDGVALGAKLPASWPERLPVRWQTPAGRGYSTPVVSRGRVFFVERRGGDEVVRSLDADSGKQVWEHAYPAPYTTHPYAASHGDWPKATTTVTGGKVFSFGISGILCCLEEEGGKPVWKRDLGSEFKSLPLFGAASSPLVEDGLVILPVGHAETSGGLMAFRASDGEIAWRAVKDGPSYSSPIAADLAGVRQVISLTAKHLVGVSLQEGKELWSYPFELPFDETIVTPMVWKDLVIVAGRNEGGTRALRLRRDGEKVVPDEVWSQKAPVYMCSPVICGGFLYAVEHVTGKLFCLKLADGSLAWKEGKFGDYASLVVAGDRILALDSSGKLTVIEPSGESCRKIASIPLSDASTYAHLVVVGSRLYVRDTSRVLCFDLAPPAPSGMPSDEGVGARNAAGR
jgi:outer membrane protein assembly factor BamB